MCVSRLCHIVFDSNLTRVPPTKVLDNCFSSGNLDGGLGAEPEGVKF